MPVSEAIPSFAVIGAVNHGKSSVVSTLSEDDAVRVSSMPGETVDVKRFRLGDLLVFFDTPGFQNARKALAEIQSAPAGGDPLAKFRGFFERHRGDPQFEAECQLLEPILAGAGIIYVVDGSLPFTDLHRCELELVRLTGAPRLAIINRTGEQDHVDEWRAALAQTFNAVREFNAYRASFEDRKDLLEALANIERGWKPQLQKAIDILQRDRESRIADAATLVVGLIRNALTYSIRRPVGTQEPNSRMDAGQNLLEQFKREIASIEARTHSAVIDLFAHRLVQSPGGSEDLFDDKLFSEETWRLLGLDRQQLMVSAAVAGGVTGASLDAIALGHTLLLGSLIGAAVGAGGAYLIGKQRPEISVALGTPARPKAMRMLLPEKFRLSSKELVVGPFDAINFPWILVDRAICTLAYVSGRTHARRDQTQIQVDKLQRWLGSDKLTVAHWPDEDRKRCEKIFAALRKNQALPDSEAQELTGIIERHFREVVKAADKSTRWSDS